MWLASNHRDAGFPGDPVELPVFQQRKSRLSKHRAFGEAYCSADPSSTWLSPGLTLSQPGKPHKSLKCSLHFGLVVGGENQILCPSLDRLFEDLHKWQNRWRPENVLFYRCLSNPCFCQVTFSYLINATV